MNGIRNGGILKAAVAMARALDRMRPVFEICEELQKAMRPFVADAERLAIHVRKAQVLDEAGWLPHYTTPLDRVEECVGDQEAVRMLLCQYYRERWPEVRREIEARLIGYRVDDEAKATFGEALTAHEAAQYRSVCRLLMPEIERVARKELHGDRAEQITSQKVLRELAAKLPVSAVKPRGFIGLNLFRRLSNHLYEHVSDEETRQRLAHDPVPNRHAAVHGLVVYSSMQNSLNALFMTDYIFQLISLLKDSEWMKKTNLESA